MPHKCHHFNLLFVKCRRFPLPGRIYQNTTLISAINNSSQLHIYKATPLKFKWSFINQNTLLKQMNICNGAVKHQCFPTNGGKCHGSINHSLFSIPCPDFRTGLCIPSLEERDAEMFVYEWTPHYTSVFRVSGSIPPSSLHCNNSPIPGLRKRGSKTCWFFLNKGLLWHLKNQLVYCG